MQITEQAWAEYVRKLAQLDEEAGAKMAHYIDIFGTDNPDNHLVTYAQALIEKYGAGSAELACQMYDELARLSGVDVPPAVPAEPASYSETAKMVWATLHSPALLRRGVSRLVKQAGADTTLKNALRDGAEFAWVPHGDTCPFCITLASRGWQRASKKAIKNGHAEHIHANCDCTYAIRFDHSTTVAGYDPEAYLAQYRAAGGDINAMRREQYAKDRKKITAQKRAAYAQRKASTKGSRNGTIILPKIEHAVLPEAKFAQYALNPARDADKARAFQEALGYNLSNYRDLMENILTHLPEYGAVEKGDWGYGMTYEVVLELEGPNGKKAKVLTAWIDDTETGEMRLTTVHVD